MNFAGLFQFELEIYFSFFRDCKKIQLRLYMREYFCFIRNEPDFNFFFQQNKTRKKNFRVKVSGKMRILFLFADVSGYLI